MGKATRCLATAPAGIACGWGPSGPVCYLVSASLPFAFSSLMIDLKYAVQKSCVEVSPKTLCTKCSPAA